MPVECYLDYKQAYDRLFEETVLVSYSRVFNTNVVSIFPWTLDLDCTNGESWVSMGIHCLCLLIVGAK